MRIRFTELAEGSGPSEVVVGLQTMEGKQEEVVISRKQANKGGIDVGSPILDKPDRCLVELPRESVAGRWRIWVPRSEVIDPMTAQAAE